MTIAIQGSSHFLWINNWRLTFTKWADAEPDNTGYCVKMDKNNNWHDHDCNQKYPFVCQVDHGKWKAGGQMGRWVYKRVGKWSKQNYVGWSDGWTGV